MEALELRAEAYEREPTTLRAEITLFDSRARLRRAAALFFPIALGSLLIAIVPPMHVLAILGPIGAFVVSRRRFRQERQFDRVAGPCPACEAGVVLPVAADAGLPVTVACPDCGEFLKLSELR